MSIHRFPRSMRMQGGGAFRRVYDARARASAGPFLVYALPNGLGHHRLGLSVSRRVGSAVVRNRAKRLVREAFRLQHSEWPGSYDLVVSVRPHELLSLQECDGHLRAAAAALHSAWLKRENR